MAVYCHYFVVYVILVQFLTVVILRRREVLRRDWLAVWLALVALCEPEIWFASQKGTGPISWIGSPKLSYIKGVSIDLAGGRLSLLLFALALSGYGIFRAWRSPSRWRYGFVTAWFLVPLLLSFLVSLVQPMFIVYYLLVIMPALALLAGAGLAQVNPRPLLIVLLMFALWQTGLELRSWYQSPRLENWSAASRYVFAHEQHGDAVIFFPDWAYAPFYYYKSLAGGRAPEPLPLLTAEAVTKQAPTVRVWTLARTQDIASYRAEQRAFNAAIVQSHPLTKTRMFGNIRVELYEVTSASDTTAAP